MHSKKEQITLLLFGSQKMSDSLGKLSESPTSKQGHTVAKLWHYPLNNFWYGYLLLAKKVLTCHLPLESKYL